MEKHTRDMNLLGTICMTLSRVKIEECPSRAMIGDELEGVRTVSEKALKGKEIKDSVRCVIPPPVPLSILYDDLTIGVSVTLTEPWLQSRCRVSEPMANS